jgi:hypothetical protein
MRALTEPLVQGGCLPKLARIGAAQPAKFAKLKDKKHDYGTRFLGLFTKHTMGGFVQVLLVLAIILGLIGLVRGNNS